MATQPTFILICDETNSHFTLRRTGEVSVVFSSMAEALARARAMAEAETLITFHDPRGHILRTSVIGPDHPKSA